MGVPILDLGRFVTCDQFDFTITDPTGSKQRVQRVPIRMEDRIASPLIVDTHSDPNKSPPEVLLEILSIVVDGKKSASTRLPHATCFSSPSLNSLPAITKGIIFDPISLLHVF